MEAALRKATIPYAVARGVEFYNRKEIKDVLAYLRLLANPADDLSCLRIINTPARGIGSATVNRLSVFAASAETSVLDSCRRGAQAGLGAAAAKRAAAFAALIDSLAGDLDRPVGRVVEAVTSGSGMEQAFRDAGEQGRQAAALGYHPREDQP